MAITNKQKCFVDEYLIDLNASQAAIRAGYSARRAGEIGYQLLQKTTIKEMIEKRMNDRMKRTEITQDRVLNELAKIGFSDIRKAVKWGPNLRETIVDDEVVMTNGVLLVDSDLLDDETAASISEINQTRDGIKIKLHDKKGALVEIGRHLGMFRDNLNIGGQDGNPIISKIEIEFVNAKNKDTSSI